MFKQAKRQGVLTASCATHADAATTSASWLLLHGRLARTVNVTINVCQLFNSHCGCFCESIDLVDALCVLLPPPLHHVKMSHAYVPCLT